MIVKYILIIVFLFAGFNVFAQPSGYYNQANGKTGTGLKTALHKIIRGHTKRSYSQLWTDFQTTDKKSNGKVWDMYSDIPGGTPSYEYTFSTDQCGTYSAEGDCYNREHSFPKSWWGGSSDTMYTDLFHIVPTDGFVNSKRANYPFGEVSSPSWTSSNGCKLGSCSYTGYSGTVFEPIDEYKGDFARNYFYMATRYLNKIDSWGPNSDMLDGSGFSSWAINLLLDWHEQDPVSQKERDRNDNVYGIQGNRNPYIDHPEFVVRIWGGNDVYAPVNADNFPLIDNESSSGFTLHAEIDEAGTVYYVILSSGAAAPTSAQVKAGQDANGNSLQASYYGAISVSSAYQDFTETVSGLSSNTSYDVYFVAEDNESPANIQDNPVKVSASTSSSGSSSGSYYSDLIITEYVEGDNNNKYLEIWNNTGASVDLSDYSVKIYFNGNTSPGSTINLSGTLASDGIFVIAHSSATVWSGTPDLSTGSLSFNGNDAVVLYNNAAKGSDVDVLGTVGNSSYWGKDKTLQRNTTTSGPSSSYNSTEWDQSSQNDVSGLGSEGALPVVWLNFSATTKNDFVELYWTTASENNNRFFELEYSYFSERYKTAGKLNGNGTSSVIHNYVFVHRPDTFPVYYRIKQVDFDGHSTFSKILVVQKQKTPVTIEKVYFSDGNINVIVNGGVVGEAEMSVYSVDGRFLGKERLNLTKDSKNLVFNGGALSAGFYLYRIIVNNKIYKGKFIVL